MPSYVLPDGVDSTAADRAALRIQCAQRCRQARKKTGTLRKSRSDEFIKQCEEDLKVTAAITLQAAARKSHAKTVVAEKRVQAAAPVELKYLNIQPSFATTTGSTPTPKTAGDLFYTMASASAFGTSLNRAFALASVASFAQISREDPETRKALQYFMMADFQPTLLHECAAVVIQCQYRVRLARRVVAKLRAMRKEKLESMHDEQLTLVAVQDIQRAVRGHLDRKLVTTQIRPVPIRPRTAPTPDAAAMRIQCAQRQRQARKEVQRRRVLRQTALEEMHSAQLVEHSTIEIQRHYRGFQHRQQKTGAPAVAPVVRGGSGRGLNALFFAAGGALLDSTGPQRCLFWGVRILHAVTMDVIIHAKQTDRMPELEFSRWVQGPLGSIIPLSRSAAVERPRSGRLPALEGRPTPRAANDDNGTSTEGSPSARKKLAPLVEKSSPP